MTTMTDSDFSGQVPSIFRDRVPFNKSATATKAPKKLPNQPQPSILSKLRSAFKSPDEVEAEDAAAALVKRQAAVREIADRLNSLTTDVEKAQARLSTAAEQFEDLKRRRQAYTESVRDSWGQINHPLDVYHQTVPVEFFYQSFAAMDAAIADYPNAKKHLAAKLAVAQKALADFKAANDLVE